MVGKDAPEGAGTYFQRRPTVTQRAISIAVSMMVATTQRVPIWCLFMLVGCWLCWYLMYEVLAGCKEGTEERIDYLYMGPALGLHYPPVTALGCYATSVVSGLAPTPPNM